MCDFKPGDEVVCVGVGKTWSSCPLAPSVGDQCTVTGVTPVDRNGVIGLRLKGFRSLGHHNGWGFDASRFRKVQRRDLSAWLKTSVGNTDKIDKRKAMAK